MKNLNAVHVMSGGVHWQIGRHSRDSAKKGLRINFDYSRIMQKRELKDALASLLDRNKDLNWLRLRANHWIVDLDDMRSFFQPLTKPEDFTDLFCELDGIDGTLRVEFEFEHHHTDAFGKKNERTHVPIFLSREELMQSQANKIFLSHKGFDKPRVRQFKETLTLLGFSPWLDEDAMPAGTPLDRGILRGFKESCAAVFFVTPAFRDETFISDEVNYAIAEKREKKDKFGIITLVFQDATGSKRTVPELLRPYVWKEPEDDLEALREVVRALPIQLGPIEWKLD